MEERLDLIQSLAIRAGHRLLLNRLRMVFIYQNKVATKTNSRYLGGKFEKPKMFGKYLLIRIICENELLCGGAVLSYQKLLML